MKTYIINYIFKINAIDYALDNVLDNAIENALDNAPYDICPIYYLFII